MTLIDPREALAEQSNFISYLMGLAALGQLVRGLAADDNHHAEPPSATYDFVYLLLGIASLGEVVERLTESVPVQRKPAAAPTDSTNTRWLR